MTKEQEEAIENIKIYIRDYISENVDEDGYTQYEISQEEQEFFENIETVLNMLKEKDKEIKMLKDIKEIADTKVTELRKIKEIDRLESENWILQVKLQDKDKMIDLMAEFIYAMWCDYPGNFTKALRNGGFDDKECGTCESKEKNCLGCLKQYYKSKVEKE